MNVLDCKFRLPRLGHFKGHPFYYRIFKTSEALFQNSCSEIESIVSIPIWFNKILKTKFHTEISKAGFNFIKDLFPENWPLTNYNGLRNIKIRKLRNIVEKTPQVWRDKISNASSTFITVNPCQKINLYGNDQFFRDITSTQIYQILIEKKHVAQSNLLRQVYCIGLKILT